MHQRCSVSSSVLCTVYQMDTIWINYFGPKDSIKKSKDGRVLLGAQINSYYYIRSRQKGLLAGRRQMCQKKVVPDHLWSTLDSPRAIQTSIWVNRDNLSINQNHPRHLWPNFKKSKIFIFFEIGQVTVTPRGSIINFILGQWHLNRSILYGWTCLGQKMA